MAKGMLKEGAWVFVLFSFSLQQNCDNSNCLGKQKTIQVIESSSNKEKFSVKHAWRRALSTEESAWVVDQVWFVCVYFTVLLLIRYYVLLHLSSAIFESGQNLSRNPSRGFSLIYM